MAASTMNVGRLLKPRQIGRIFTRNYQEHVVKTVEQRQHFTGEGTIRMWRNISIFVGGPLVALGTVRLIMELMEGEHEEHPPFVHYQYLKIMNKRFPWGDGAHPFFFNPKVNYIPGVGYEK